MKYFLVLAVVIAGCGKKQDSAPAASSSPSSAPAASSSPSSAPAAADDATMLPVPDGAPQSCKDAYPLEQAYQACAAIDAQQKKDAIQKWNASVRGSFTKYPTMSDGGKKVVEGSCATMINARKALLDLKGCK